jgi:hypothetical protein
VDGTLIRADLQVTGQINLDDAAVTSLLKAVEIRWLGSQTRPCVGSAGDLGNRLPRSRQEKHIDQKVDIRESRISVDNVGAEIAAPDEEESEDAVEHI